MKLLQQAAEMWEVPRDLLLGRYPEFVTGGPLPRGHVPVFVFHSLEPLSFERRLRYLLDNGYRTLSADEYHGVVLGIRPAPDRAVLLTFDDGRGSLWTVGAPLLRRYGMRGVVFLVPGRVPTRPGAPAPTWDDVEAGRVPAPEVLGREAGEGAFLSWSEVESLARGEVLEFHSHSLTHARVHVSGELCGFVTPANRHGYQGMDLPLIGTEGGDLLGDAVPLGTPYFRSAPRLSEAQRFHEAAEVRRAAVDEVGNDPAYFTRPGWQRRLRRLVPAATGRHETADERLAAVRRELSESRKLIEERTGRRSVHLCYPWHVSGPTAHALAREAGYRTAFWGKVPGVPLTLPGGDLERIARVGEDYLELLPGEGRQSLHAVLRHKWLRRLRGKK